MFDLSLGQATIKTVGTHQFYLFPKPPTHTNQRDRPPTYADPALLTRYEGTGSNGSAKLLPGKVHSAAHAMMSSLRRVGDRINDWSMKSAVVQSGFRPDDASQGANYLRITKQTIREKPDIFGELEFPTNLETEAQSVLGRPGDSRRAAFHQHLAAAPGWSAELVARLFNIVDNVYAPRGANPHATGLVFDLDFTILVASVRRDGKSLGQMAKEEINPVAGMAAMVAILAIMIILLAVLALVVVNALRGSPWGLFTIASTIPIALLMGWWMKMLRPGKVLEATVIGVVLMMLGLVGGQWVSQNAAWAAAFMIKASLSRLLKSASASPRTSNACRAATADMPAVFGWK